MPSIVAQEVGGMFALESDRINNPGGTGSSLIPAENPQHEDSYRFVTRVHFMLFFLLVHKSGFAVILVRGTTEMFTTYRKSLVEL